MKRHGHLLVFAALVVCSRSDAQSPPINFPEEVKMDGSAIFVAQGEFRPTLEAARDSALRAAQQQIRDWLAKQDPPVSQPPSIETIRRDYQLKEYAPEEEPILSGSDRVYKITLEVTLTPKAIRDLRARDRAEKGVRGIVFFTVTFAGFVLLLRFRSGRRLSVRGTSR